MQTKKVLLITGILGSATIGLFVQPFWEANATVAIAVILLCALVLALLRTALQWKHSYLLGSTEPRTKWPAMLSTTFLLLLGVQMVGIVFAMGYSLLQSVDHHDANKFSIFGDFDNDGDMDFVLLNNGPSFGGHQFYRNSGTGSFARSDFGGNNGATAFGVGDTDGDGDLDVYYTTIVGSVRSVCTNNGSASFSCAADPTTIGGDQNFVFGDFNNDGALDLVRSDYSSTSKALYVNVNRKGRLISQTGSTLGVLQTRSMRTADFSSDGFLDITGTSAAGYLVVYVSSGTGGFNLSYTSPAQIENPKALGDFDGDGDIDVIANDTSYNGKLYANNGLGTSFSVSSTGITSAASANAMETADLDNDGDLDLIIGYISGGSRVFLNDGTGNFTENGSASETGDNSQSIALGDIDADGDIDYVRGTNAAPSRIYRSDQAATSSNGAPTAPSAGSMSAVSDPGSRSGLIFANDAAYGTYDWSSVGNAASADGSSATCALSIGETTKYLKATNFGFSLPTDAVISGITAEVKRRSDGVAGNVEDAAVRIVKGGTAQSTDRSAAGNWPDTLTYASYGGSTDLWGTTWTASDINSSGFGFAIAARGTVAGSPSGYIDHIRITVHSNYGNVTLSWGSGSDIETSTRLLQYQVKVGTGSNAGNIVTAAPSNTSGVNRLLPNGQSRRYALQNLPCGHTYYWNVAAVDTGLKKTWGTETIFTIDSSCAISTGGSSSSSGGGGGGGWWTTLGYGGTTPKVIPKEKATLSVHAFEDVSGNGKRETLESSAGFKGLPVTIEGVTEAGKSIKKIITMDDGGVVEVKITPGTYTVTVDAESLVVRGKKPTTPVVFEGIVLTTGETRSFDTGFREETLLRHAPCLQIGDGEGTKGASDGETLLRRLQNAAGRPVTSNVSLDEFLMTRRTFLRLLVSMHCVDLSQGEAALKEKLRTAFDRKVIPGWTSIELRDLPLSPLTEDSRTVYNLLAEGVPVVRTSAKGGIADLSSPVSRADAVKIIAALLQIPTEKRASRGVLPTDLSPKDPLLSDLFTLQSFGILPESFLPVLGPLQGMSTREASLLLVRSAFRGGKIDLLPEYGLKQAATDSFLRRALPSFALPKQITKDPLRADRVSFADILPGDDLYAPLRAALAFGVKNSGGEVLWLIPGTLRPSEFGVDKGQTTLRQSEPATLLETVRALVVLSGIPPPTRAAVVTGQDKRDSEGKGERRATADQISNLPRDGSLPSRFFYRAQDSIRAYNVSLFLYAPWILKRPVQSPMATLTVEEAADLVASTLIGIAVRGGDIPPQEADKTMLSLRTSIVQDLLPEGENQTVAKNTLFTKGMLTEILGTIVRDAVNGDTKSFTTEMSTGMFWWNRVR